MKENIYAGFLLRLVAHIIDTLILIYANIINILFLEMINVNIITSDVSLLILIVWTGWIYYSLMESSNKQATFGKMALKLKVTDLKKKPISFGKASVRFFLKVLSWFLYIGFLIIIFTKKKQWLHDKLAGCLVLKEY